LFKIRTKFAALALAAAGLAAGAGAVAAAAPAGAATVQPAQTQTCNECIHVQNVYAFRGALDALQQKTAINSPIGLWYERPTTTDPGADLLAVPDGVVSNRGKVNQSGLNWSQYKGLQVVRLKFDPNGNGGADTYIGLEGPNPATATKLALRADNSNSIWQEWIVLPVGPDNIPNLGVTSSSIFASGKYVLINVGQTVNTYDPEVATDPNNALTGSLVQQDVEHVQINQNYEVPTNQLWNTQGVGRNNLAPAS
jgi:hypothetical protein